MDIINQNNDFVIGNNYQDGIPGPQADPPIQINQHYLPNGDLTISSNYDYSAQDITKIVVPIVDVPSLFGTTFDGSEQDLVMTAQIEYEFNYYHPLHQIIMPNIAQFIGNLVTGVDLYDKSMEAMLICTQGYLNGIYEILPNGMFLALKEQRDGTNRRYSNLCKAIYFALSSTIYKDMPARSEMNIEMQSLIQDKMMPGATSMLVKVKPYVYQNQEYNVTTPMFNMWAQTTPWHALMFNSQAPLTMDQFIQLFIKIFAINNGKTLRYTMSYTNKQPILSIVPNSDLFVALNPPNMVSSIKYSNPAITERFVTFIRYLSYSVFVGLDWDDTDLGSENEDTDEETESENENGPVDPDEELGYNQ